MNPTQHPAEILLLRYASGRLPGAERASVDAHAADCAACRDRLTGLAYLREHFEEAASWTAADYGFFCLQKRVATAVESAPAFAERVRDWLRRKAAGLSLDLRVLVDGTRNVAAMACRLPSGYEGRLQLAYSGVGSPEQVAELRGHLARGAEWLEKGKPEESRRELLEAVRIDARSPQAAVTDIQRAGRRVIQATADSRRRCISVKAFPEPGHPVPALAILLSGQADGPVLFALFQPVPGEAALLATFSPVDDGLYSIEVDCG